MIANTLSGFLLLDKPKDITSFDVIRALRKQTGIKTFGHAGTLDPFATGLLIIAVNKYTRLLSLLEYAEKEYTATLILGKATITGDTESEIIKTDNRDISEKDIISLNSAVLKIQTLKPPIYSAIKVNGKRAYDRARAEEEFDLPERESNIYDFNIESYNYPSLTYSCRVSKGTYIRSLSQWIAEYLGTIAYTSDLRRTAIGNISVIKASQLAEITINNLNEHLLSAVNVLPNLETILLNDIPMSRIRNGLSISNPGKDNGEILLLDITENCIGIGFRKDDLLYPKVNL